MITLIFSSFLQQVKRKLFFRLRLHSLFENNLSSFYFRALNKQTFWADIGWGNKSINYYEFGVGWGGTLINYIDALKAYCRCSKKDFYSTNIFGFDSFEGLPEKKGPKDGNVDWHKGQFSYSLSYIEEILTKEGIDLKRGNIRFIKGFFEKTLTPALIDELSAFSPTIVTIDCDYYSSTKTVLEWLRPMLHSGTLFYFDDIWSFHGNPNYGQLAAINEFNDVGDGYLTPFPLLGLNSQIFIYSRKDLEFENI